MEIKSETVLQKEVLSVSEAAKFKNATVQSMQYAMANDLIDFTRIRDTLFIVMTEKSKAYLGKPPKKRTMVMKF